MRHAGTVMLIGLLVGAASTGPLLAESVPAPRDSNALATTGAQRSTNLRSFTVAATGDVLTENAVLRAGQRFGAEANVRYDFGPLFAPISPIVSGAHLAICHMELPIGAPDETRVLFGRSPFGGNLLLSPFEIAQGLRSAGFDRCSTASNHSNDLNVGGIDSTLDALDAAGLSHVGTARTIEEAVPEILLVNGVKVAHLSYTRYSNTVKSTDSWRLNFAYDSDQVVADVVKARASGAEVVILSVHISQELQRAPIARDRAFITEVTAKTKIDLVIEHGPHVIQPIEQVNGTWVYWSVGNLISGMGLPGASRYGPPTLDGLLAWAAFEETTAGNFVVTPSSVVLCNEQFGRIVYPAITTLEEQGLSPNLRSQLVACRDRSLPLVPSAN
jgi:hypothetical protein